MSLEPAIAATVGFLLLGQLLHLSDLVAIACVALASAGASVSGPKENYCTACWSGEYCVPVDRHQGRHGMHWHESRH